MFLDLDYFPNIEVGVRILKESLPVVGESPRFDVPDFTRVEYTLLECGQFSRSSL